MKLKRLMLLPVVLSLCACAGPAVAPDHVKADASSSPNSPSGAAAGNQGGLGSAGYTEGKPN